MRRLFDAELKQSAFFFCLFLQPKLQHRRLCSFYFLWKQDLLCSSGELGCVTYNRDTCETYHQVMEQKLPGLTQLLVEQHVKEVVHEVACKKKKKKKKRRQIQFKIPSFKTKKNVQSVTDFFDNGIFECVKEPRSHGYWRPRRILEWVYSYLPTPPPFPSRQPYPW